jgi:tetratricopeptide (TPR) repeat protein
MKDQKRTPSPFHKVAKLTSRLSGTWAGLTVDVAAAAGPRRAPASPGTVARVSHETSPARPREKPIRPAAAKRVSPAAAPAAKRARPNLTVDVVSANAEAARRLSVRTIAQAYACDAGLVVDVEQANDDASQASRDACVVGASLLERAAALRRTSRGEAEACVRRAAKLLDGVPAPPRLQADAHTALGELLATSGRFEEAQTRYQSALALREACARELGSDEARLAVATALTNLATTLHARADGSCIPLLRRSCSIKRVVLGTNDPRVAKAILRLATVLARDGPVAAVASRLSPKNAARFPDYLVRVAEARKLRERALTILAVRRGPDHADTLKAAAKLAAMD